MKNILKNFLYDKNLKKDALTEINHQVDEELKKSKSNQNYKKIETLLSESYEIMGNSERELDLKAEENIAKIKQMCKPKKRIKIYQRVAAVAACLALVFGGNAYTLKAYGESLFSLIVNRTESGFTVIFNGDNNTDSETPDVKDDPYGMIAKCAEYGVYPDTPLYIPDGFELVNFKVNEYTKRTRIKINYQKNDIVLTFLFEKYNNSDDIPNKSIPSDELNLSEVQVNGTVGIVSKEKNSLNKTTDQYELIYCKDNIIYIISSDGLAYNECDKITESMTSNPFEENEGTVHNDVIINTVLPYLKIWNI